MIQLPNEEQRGGDKPDWENVVAGEPLPSIAPEQDAAWKEMVRLGEEIQGGRDLDLGDLPE